MVLREVLVNDKGRIYSLIACRYDGIVRKMSEAELCVGIYHVLHPDIELFLPYMDRKIRILSKKIAQMTMPVYRAKPIKMCFANCRGYAKRRFGMG